MYALQDLIFDFQFSVSSFELDSAGVFGGLFERLYATQFARKNSNCYRQRRGISTGRSGYRFYVRGRTHGGSIGSKY